MYEPSFFTRADKIRRKQVMGNTGSGAAAPGRDVHHKPGDPPPSSPGKDGGQAFVFDKKPATKLVFQSSHEEEEPYYTKDQTQVRVQYGIVPTVAPEYCDDGGRENNQEEFSSTPRQRSATVSEGTKVDDKVPTVFKWEGGGRQVLISGTFSNWKTLPMVKRVCCTWGNMQVMCVAAVRVFLQVVQPTNQLLHDRQDQRDTYISSHHHLPHASLQVFNTCGNILHLGILCGYWLTEGIQGITVGILAESRGLLLEYWLTEGLQGTTVGILADRGHGDFVTIIDLPEGEHQYKFYVDGEWRHDPGVRIVDNGMGSKNNMVTVKNTDFEVFQALAIDSEGSGGNQQSKTFYNSSSHASYQLMRCLFVTEEYSQEVPANKPWEKVSGPPVLPPHLLQVILNKDTPLSCEPTLLPEPNHVMLNHLYALSIKDGVMVLSATHRYRKKYVTTLLYKPI
uniref:5'-AMP-activated protein kinase subunit beta-1 n=1 Tax=Timema poppense TaxID=170557 RepID=A0A7R9DK50_TIMPO|nr:unnamed protein product [Timema poppensis]